jgi:hypothetical protein
MLSNSRYLRVGANDPNGSVDRPQRTSELSDSDRRFGVDWGNFGSACLSFSMVVGLVTRKVSMFWT